MIKNKLKGFKLYYINIRDIKKKRQSFDEIINEQKPTVIAVTETHVDDEYGLEFEGYKMFDNNRNLEGGGVVIAVRKEIKSITVEVKKTKESFESLWVLINNTRIKVRIGVVYFPQEQDQNLKKIYSEIKPQIQEARNNDEGLIIVGDFNCKVGKSIDGNKEVVSKGGKKMLEVMEKERLVLANSLEKCEGTWTREENGKKSILDYILVNEEMADYITKMTIYDKSKEMSPFHLKRSKRVIRSVYSDHNPIIMETDLVMKQTDEEENKKRQVLTPEGMLNYERELEERKVSKIWEQVNNIDVTYKKWQTQVEEIKRKHEQTRKMTKKRKTKTMRLLMKEKKELKKNMRIKGNDNGSMEKLRNLKEQILSEEAENYYRRLRRTCEEISKNGKFNSGSFWEVKKKMERKRKEGAHAVKNKDGKLVTENNEILTAYKDYFEELLSITNRKTNLEENKEIVEKVEKEFNEIIEKGKMQEPMKTSREVVAAVMKDLKRKKARDTFGWNNEMLLDGGNEMIESLRKMADAVQMTCSTPSPWNQMMIKSTHKKGLKKN